MTIQSVTHEQEQAHEQKHEHLKWLVDSRTQNQVTSARLYGLMKTAREKKTCAYDASTLVSIGFSLWRAAFLASKSGKFEETIKHSIDFLGEVLETNAIAFVQDKNARGFTFNYYLANVRFRLAEYKAENESFEVDPCLLKKGMLDGKTPKERWRRFQQAFDKAVDHFEIHLNQKLVSGASDHD